MPSQGVLVLRNGQVLQGKITHVGDLYYVVLPDGEIRIKTATVEFACGSIEEAYRRKRSGIRVGNAEDHIQMAQWCQQQGLLGAAAAELAEAMAADPGNRMIPYLERRLKMAMEPAKHLVASAKPADRGPTADDLDRLTRSMPPGTVETFTTTVQPLLMNHCATAECHGLQSTAEFRLMRVHPGSPTSRRLTQRNLYAALKYLDRQRPEASPLLTAPIRPHGTAPKEVFADKDAAQYRLLVQWASAVVGSEPPAAKPPMGDRRVPVSVQAMPDAAPTLDDQPQPPQAVKVQRGASPPKAEPSDPFDPEVFNRQFSKAK